MIENPPPETNAASTAPEMATSAAPEGSATDSPATFAAASFENEVAQQAAAAPPIESAVASAAAGASSTAVMTPSEDPTDDTARAAPRALSPGALLQGEVEIKEVLARGMTNLYRADSGGYGPSQPWIVAERVLPPEPPAAPVVAPITAPIPVQTPVPTDPIEAAPAELPAAEAPAASTSTPESIEVDSEVAPSDVAASVSVLAEEIPLSELARSTGTGLTDAGEFEHASQSGGMSSESGIYDAAEESEIAIMEPAQTAPTTQALPAAPILPREPAPEELYYDDEPLQPVTLRPAELVNLDLVQQQPEPEEEEEDPSGVPSLLMPGEVWEQDGRQYCAWEWAETTSLQDFRDSTNDERYFQVLGRVAEAMAFRQEQGRVLELNRDTLRFDARGQIHFYGFSSPLQDPAELLSQLRGVNEFLLKHTFANSGTMRLDDPFAGLPLADETKGFAHQLAEGEFAAFEAAHAALQVLAGVDELEMSVALLSDVGQQRELNEDSGLIARCSRKTMLSPLEWELLVVADGMGGHEGGEIASDLTVRVLHQQFLEARWNWNDNAAVRAGMLAAISATNARVAALAEEPKYKGSRSRPGSTLTFAVRVGRRLWIGNVGDSRTYLFRDGVLGRVTKDHSYVQNLIDAGSLDEEDAWDHPDGSIITAHIGEANLKTRDVFMRLLLPGDKLLLVSDGVVDMLRDRDIAPFLQHEHPGAICRGLVAAANAAGGADNITALCLCCY